MPFWQSSFGGIWHGQAMRYTEYSCDPCQAIRIDELKFKFKDLIVLEEGFCWKSPLPSMI